MEKRNKEKIQIVSAGLFLLYLICLTYFLFFAESLGRSYAEREYTYNLHLFKEIARFWNYREELGMAGSVGKYCRQCSMFCPVWSVSSGTEPKSQEFFYDTGTFF